MYAKNIGSFLTTLVAYLVPKALGFLVLRSVGFRDFYY